MSLLGLRLVGDGRPRKGERVSFIEDVGRDRRTARQVTRIGGENEVVRKRS
jgi:hypothetical protein